MDVSYGRHINSVSIQYNTDRSGLSIIRKVLRLGWVRVRLGSEQPTYHSQGFEDKNVGSSPDLLGQ